MAKINLLPWRAERRERRKREFFAHLIVAAVAAVVLVLLWGFVMSLRISHQNANNAYLQVQIQQLDAKIVEIQNLQKVKNHLLARKRIVEKLQASRSQMVHLFDQMVDTIPPGARLTALKQQGDKLTLDGVAQSYDTVARYMRRIEASPWMGPAHLVKAEKFQTASNAPYQFELIVGLGTPKSGEEGAPATAGSSGAVPAAATTSAPAQVGASPHGVGAPAPLAPATAPAAATTPPAAPAASATSAAAPRDSVPALKAPPSAAATTTGGARP